MILNKDSIGKFFITRCGMIIEIMDFGDPKLSYPIFGYSITDEDIAMNWTINGNLFTSIEKDNLDLIREVKKSKNPEYFI